MKYILLMVLALAVFSCDRDNYLVDGGVSSPYVNATTYDYLTTNPLFDTLVMAIDKAGLKEMLDGETTLFALTNFSFTNYINIQLTNGRKINPNFTYTFDDIPMDVLRDSLSMYIFPGKIMRQDMRKEGDVFASMAGTRLRISLEPREDYTDQLSDNPEYVFLTYKRGTSWDAWDAQGVATAEADTRERIQTSNLLSTNGVIHVMPNTHALSFTRAQ